jgi:hypothetical protein
LPSFCASFPGYFRAKKKPLPALAEAFLKLLNFLLRPEKVAPIGFEPMTGYLEGSCSIQLSYGVKSIEKMSGWQDSNLRPSAPKADAIPGYATPRKENYELKIAN